MTKKEKKGEAKKSSFQDFSLDERLLEALVELGFKDPTPIQEHAIGPLLEGRDIIGRARTGSGKTAAFGLPLLQLVREGPHKVGCIVLTPTRELAIQVSEALQSYGSHLRIRVLAVYGGAAYFPQLKALKAGVDVVVGTPGRVLDHLGRGTLNLSTVQLLVLDEADEMLRMGFIDDVEKIIQACPPGRQVALFSATMPDAIRRVADRHLDHAIEVQVESSKLSVDHIEQQWMRVPDRHKLDALVRTLKGRAFVAALVFARTRLSCAEIAAALSERGLAVEPLHGDLNQSAREAVFKRFRSQRTQVVIATDVAARGIDVAHITHVINLDLPNDAESYVHRIGRTGRAGRKGTAISFVSPKQEGKLRYFKKALGVDIKEVAVPSDADVARKQREALREMLGEAIGGNALDAARDWLAEVLEETGWTAEDVAASGIRQLAAQTGGSFTSVPDDEPPAWARSRGGKRTERELTESNEVEVFLAIGFQNGVRPQDIVGALANAAGVPGKRIGRITIVERKSFVGLPRNLAQKLVSDFKEVEIRGVSVRVALAHPREQTREQRPTQGKGRPGPGGPPWKRGGRPFGKPGKKPWKGRAGLGRRGG